MILRKLSGAGLVGFTHIRPHVFCLSEHRRFLLTSQFVQGDTVAWDDACMCFCVWGCWGIAGVLQIPCRLSYTCQGIQDIGGSVSILFVEACSCVCDHHHRHMGLVTTAVQRLFTLLRGSKVGGADVLSMQDKDP